MLPLTTLVPIPRAEDPSGPSVTDLGSALEDVVSLNWWLNTAAPTVVRIVVIVAVAVVFRTLLVKAADRFVKRLANREVKAHDSATRAIYMARRSQRATTLGALFKNIITIVVLGFMTLLVLSELNFDLAPLLAGAGVAGIALGFGAQSLVSDFLSGIFILMEDQYGVGDVVDVGDATGTVEEVQLRITKLRSLDGTLWFVRNGEIMRVGNMSQDYSRSVLDISIAYGSDVKRAKEVLQTVAHHYANDPRTSYLVLEEPKVLGVESLAADSVVIRLLLKTRPGEQWGVSRQLRENIKNAFDKAGIEIPFPQRTMWMRRYPGDDSGTDLT